MVVDILCETGYELAIRGLAYSYRDQSIPFDEWWTLPKIHKMMKVAESLTKRGPEERKWIRQIELWVDIVAPRFFWSEFDTYKIATVTQSESTMHKLAKREPLYTDFSCDTHPAIIEAFKTVWAANKGDIQAIKAALPEGYLQRRLVKMNYEVVRTMIVQRKDHRLREWKDFCSQIYAQLQHPELIEDAMS